MRLTGVGKRYRRRGPWVLRDISVDLPKGRAIRVVGGNGSGKSTLLRVLAGVSSPSAGRVVDRPRTGYVPERFPPALPFTARDYLVHLGRIHGLRAPVARHRAEACLEVLGATSFARTPLAQLSKGTCQKVAVAQALISEPALLVLDEAWTGLDEPARTALDTLLAERLADGASVVYVDHSPARSTTPAGLTWRLTAGTVATAGAVATVDAAPSMIEKVPLAHGGAVYVRREESP